MSDLSLRRIAKSFPGTIHISIDSGPDDRDEYSLEGDDVPCCMAGAMRGPRACTCWEPVYDVEQTPVDEAVAYSPADVHTREACCHDCAYRNGSPERAEGYDDELQDIAGDGSRFACHYGSDFYSMLGAWILRRAISECSLDPNEWASVSSSLVSGIRKATDESAAAVEMSSFIVLPIATATAQFPKGSSSCTPATTPPVSPTSTSGAGLSLRTMLTWLEREGLSMSGENEATEPNSQTRRLLRYAAEAMRANNSSPWLPSSGYTPPTLGASLAEYDASTDRVTARMRRVVAWRHPDGRELPAGEGDYEPPIVGLVAFRADGTPADYCAGWAAHRRALLGADA